MIDVVSGCWKGRTKVVTTKQMLRLLIKMLELPERCYQQANVIKYQKNCVNMKGYQRYINVNIYLRVGLNLTRNFNEFRGLL
jgi:hypothetical protein